MTNEQFAILIRAWRNRLEREIDLLDDKLGAAGFERARERVYTGPTVLGMATEANNPEHWKEGEPTGDCLALSGLNELVAELSEAADLLLRDVSSQP